MDNEAKRRRVTTTLERVIMAASLGGLIGAMGALSFFSRFKNHINELEMIGTLEARVAYLATESAENGFEAGQSPSDVRTARVLATAAAVSELGSVGLERLGIPEKAVDSLVGLRIDTDDGKQYIGSGGIIWDEEADRWIILTAGHATDLDNTLGIKKITFFKSPNEEITLEATRIGMAGVYETMNGVYKDMGVLIVSDGSGLETLYDRQKVLRLSDLWFGNVPSGTELSGLGWLSCDDGSVCKTAMVGGQISAIERNIFKQTGPVVDGVYLVGGNSGGIVYGNMSGNFRAIGVWGANFNLGGSDVHSTAAIDNGIICKLGDLGEILFRELIKQAGDQINP